MFPDFSPIRGNPALARLLTGQFVSNLGTSMTSYAITLQVWALTRSSFAVGALGFTFIPMMIFGLFGGSIADSADRKRLAIGSTAALMAVSALLTAQAFAGSRLLLPLYTLAVVQAVAQAIGVPARRTFIPQLVSKDRLAAAIALNTLSGRLSALSGAALAGVVTGIAGLKTCYLIDTLSFFSSLYVIGRLPAMRPGGGGRPRASPLRAAAEGLHYIRGSPVLLGSFLSDLDAMLFGMPVALFPAFNAKYFDGSPQTLGLLNSAVGVGGLTSAVLSGRTARIRRQGLGMLVSTGVWGSAIAIFALVHGFIAALLMLAIAGAADTLTITFRGSIVQTVTPDALRGRVSSVEYIVGTGGVPLGNIEAGAIASLAGSAEVSAFTGGLGCLIGAALLAAAIPALTRYGRQ